MEYHKILTLEPLKGTFLIDGFLTEVIEVFKDIPGYEGLYQVSDFGRIKRLRRKRLNSGYLEERIMVSTISNRGYRQLYLTRYCVFKDNNVRKMYSVHTLVAMGFLGRKPDYTMKIVVDHIDGDKLNNCASNLRLCSQKENMDYALETVQFKRRNSKK